MNFPDDCWIILNRNNFEMVSGKFWDYFGHDFGIILGMLSGWICNNFRINLFSVWFQGYFQIILGCGWDYFEIVSEWFGHVFGMILKLFWNGFIRAPIIIVPSTELAYHGALNAWTFWDPHSNEDTNKPKGFILMSYVSYSSLFWRYNSRSSA